MASEQVIHVNVEEVLREQIQIMATKRCHFFNGVQHDVCDAGVRYDSFSPVPCVMFTAKWNLGEGCELFRLSTPEEVEVEVQRRLGQFSRAQKVMDEGLLPVIQTDGKNKPNLRGQIACPACKTGAIRYYTAGNGHLHAACSTKGCFTMHQ